MALFALGRVARGCAALQGARGAAAAAPRGFAAAASAADGADFELEVRQGPQPTPRGGMGSPPWRASGEHGGGPGPGGAWILGLR